MRLVLLEASLDCNSISFVFKTWVQIQITGANGKCDKSWRQGKFLTKPTIQNMRKFRKSRLLVHQQKTLGENLVFQQTSGTNDYMSNDIVENFLYRGKDISESGI